MTLPPLDRAALMLDLDGTLLDIAPAPDLVVVPPGLPGALRALRARLGEALAVVSGRPLEQLAALLGDAPHALAGEHGAALRRAPGAAIERAPLPVPDQAWLAAAARLVDAHPGALLETKERSFVLHYRAAPSLGAALGEALAALIAADPRFFLMPARMAWEVRPRGADKGTAVAALMAEPPFAGRLPVFIGDDVTDEDGIAEAVRRGGAGLRVPEAFGGSPERVRRFLAKAAENAAWPAFDVAP